MFGWPLSTPSCSTLALALTRSSISPPATFQLTKPCQVRLFGKGRKERFCPLWPQTAHGLRAFCQQRQLELNSDVRVFSNHRGEPLTRFGVRYLLRKYLDRAKTYAPGLV